MITILLLSHNNPDHLKRALSYYKQIEFKGRILIADSSKDEFRQQVRDVLVAAEERLFAPVLFEYDKDLSYIEKIAAVSREVVTSYLLLAGVDDFFSQRGMLEAMHFLKSHPDYAFAYGRMYGFTYDGRDISSYYIGYFDGMISFEKDSPLERLRDFFPRYSASFYSVFRTSIFQNVLSRSAKVAREYATSDNFATMLLLLEGKAKFLPLPFHWRELSDDSYGMIYLQEWLIGEKFKQDFVRMKACLKEVFIEKNLCSSEQAETVSSQCIDEFIEHRTALTFEQEHSLKKVIKGKLPQRVQDALAQVKFGIKNFFISANRSALLDKKSVYAKEFEIMKHEIASSGIMALRTDDFRYTKRI